MERVSCLPASYHHSTASVHTNYSSWNCFRVHTTIKKSLRKSLSTFQWLKMSMHSWIIYCRARLKGRPQIWQIWFLLLHTTSAWLCLQHLPSRALLSQCNIWYWYWLCPMTNSKTVIVFAPLPDWHCYWFRFLYMRVIRRPLLVVQYLSMFYQTHQAHCP